MDARGVKTPEELWAVATAYFRFCVARDIHTMEYRSVSIGQNSGSEIEEIEKPNPRPFTYAGFHVYSGLSRAALDEIAERSDEYAFVVSRIGAVMHAQKFEFATAGAMNANLIARDLGLSEKTDHRSNVTMKVTVEEIIIDPQGRDE